VNQALASMKVPEAVLHAAAQKAAATPPPDQTGMPTQGQDTPPPPAIPQPLPEGV
jgi:hypothetical protein